jgi:GH24 family phage-related lysozyme (muramidase)
MDKKEIGSWIEQWEGYRDTAYDDKTGKTITDLSKVEGKPTIGIGFNLEKEGAKDAIEGLGYNYDDVKAGKAQLQDQHIRTLFNNDIDEAIKGTKNIFPNIEQMPSEKQKVVVDMVYNMGEKGFSGFDETIKAIKAEDWQRAGQEMKDSLWYGQVGNRGEANVNLMSKMPSIEESSQIQRNETDDLTKSGVSKFGQKLKEDSYTLPELNSTRSREHPSFER